MGWRFAPLLFLCIVSILVACSEATPPSEPVTLVPLPTGTAIVSPATVAPIPTVTTVAPASTATAVAPVPTEAPLPVPTSAPTAEPPPPTAVQFVSEEHSAASERVFGLVNELVEELGHREGGTPEELSAAEHLKMRFDEMGYSAEIQPFSLELFDIARYMQTRGENAKVVVESPIEAQSPGLLLSTAPKGGKQTGSLVSVGQGRSEDLPADGLAGKIVLIQPGDIPLNDPQTLSALLEKANSAGAAGAIAAVISGNISGMEQYRPLLAAPSEIPALILPQAEIGDQLHAASQSGEVLLSVMIETQEMGSQNVVAELEGEGDGLVIVGGHYDVVPQTVAGANDNTSGIAVVLELAEAFAGETLPFSVRFMAFGAEEIGLYGSSRYVASLSEAELGRIVAMLNFDVVASGPLLAVTGQEELVELAQRIAADLGLESVSQPLPAGASSDHQPFQSAGVPVLVLYGPDVSRIHTPEDRLEFVQPELLGSALLVAEALLRSPEFPQ